MIGNFGIVLFLKKNVINFKLKKKVVQGAMARAKQTEIIFLNVVHFYRKIIPETRFSTITGKLLAFVT